jgi:hypothetical protein
MKLFRKFAVAVTLAMLAVTTASAGTVVMTDSGSIGGVELMNTGISGTTATIVISRIPNLFSVVNTVNGVSLLTPEPANVDGPITMLVTPNGTEHYNLALVPSTYVKEVGGVSGAEARMAFNVTSGVAPTVLPNFFNMSGVITSLLENDNPRLDYQLFAAGGGINFTFTGTTFGGGIDSFAQLFTTVGSDIVANGSFSQNAVPEPGTMVTMSMGILPIGIALLFRLRRRK